MLEFLAHLQLLPATAPADPAVPSSVQIETVWDFVVKGGWMMIPIGLCSLEAVGIP